MSCCIFGSSSTHSGIYKNPYTLSKFQGEMLCTMYTKVYGLPISVCRFYNVYASNQLTEGLYYFDRLVKKT